jgi:hypothetical protein
MAGFRRERDIEITDTDEWSYDFTLDRTTPRADFRLVMDEAVGNLFTDCAVNIIDENGTVVRATGFGGLEVNVGARLPADRDSAEYKLEVVGGFALARDMEKWGFTLEEEYRFADAVTGSVTRAGGGDLHLYCGVPTEVEVEFAGGWPAPPADLHPFGAVRFRDSNTADKVPGDRGGRLVLEVPIRLE